MKVSFEIAQQEVESWLDYKKVSDNKREDKKDQIETLVNAICEGDLILKEDKSFVHNLKFPFGKEQIVKELTYKARVNAGAIHNALQGVKSSDIHGMLFGYVAALSGESKSTISLMDSEDYSIAQSVAVFFM